MHVQVALICLALVAVVGAAWIGGIVRPSDELVWRKLLVLLLPIVWFFGVSLIDVGGSWSWRAVYLFVAALPAVPFIGGPILALGVSWQQAREFLSAPPLRPSIRGLAIVVAYGAVCASLVAHQASGAFTREDVIAMLKVLWVGYLAIAVIGPITEEWYARGVLWSLFPQSYGVSRRALVLAVIMTAQHVPTHLTNSGIASSMGSIFIGSLAFGFVRGYAGMRWGILLHGIHNATVLSLLFFDPNAL